MINDKWLYEISSKHKLINLNFREIWRYRDLLFLFVKRDIVTVYKQTILGPLWFFIQPLFTSVIFTLVFNNIASISTGSIPAFLFIPKSGQPQMAKGALPKETFEKVITDVLMVK